jgi:hypothetical protein
MKFRRHRTPSPTIIPGTLSVNATERNAMVGQTAWRFQTAELFALVSTDTIPQGRIPMGDSNPKNNQKKKAQQSAKKASNQKKPATPSAPPHGKKR